MRKCPTSKFKKSSLFNFVQENFWPRPREFLTKAKRILDLWPREFLTGQENFRLKAKKILDLSKKFLNLSKRIFSHGLKNFWLKAKRIFDWRPRDFLTEGKEIFLSSDDLNSTSESFFWPATILQGKKSSTAGRKKAPHFGVVAQKGRYKESQKGKKLWRKKTETRLLQLWFYGEMGAFSQ